jgi:hypothetical protein
MSANFEDTKWYSYTSSTQTRKTWARHLRAYEEIPQEFQPAFPEYTDHFPYTLLLPEGRLSLFRKRNKKILCMHDDRFVLLEALHNEIKTSSNEFTDLIYLERGMILLNSWLKIVTPSDTLLIRFNTTNEYLFDPVIDQVRQGMNGSPSNDVTVGENEQELSKFDYLRTVNFKHMNYGRKSIRAGDPVIGIIYQPERCIREYKLLSRTIFRQCATAHLSILTEKELILIKEDKQVKTNKDSKYGGVFTYIPRRQIHDVSFVPSPENSHCTLEITLPGNTHLASEFSSDNEELELVQSFLE